MAFDTTSRLSNLPLVDFVCDYLEGPGVGIRRNPSPDHDKANVVITLGPGGGDGRPGLVLSGHTDVVPAEEPEWESDPFALVERGGAYVGRGACDMKGFLALAVNRAAGVEPGRLRRPLALLLTYDEELGTLGAKQFVDTYPDIHALPRDVIIGEPTELRVARMHKGYLKLRLTLRGVPAHSGYPHLGDNAIEPAARAIVSLEGLRRALEQERPAHAEQFGEVPYAALNVARVAGGVAINVVPDRCVVELGVRLLPGMSSPEMVERVRAAVQDALGTRAFELEILGDSPAMLLDEETAVYRSLCRDVDQRRSHSISFATDGGWLTAHGFRCVVFGPGSIEVAHKPNEWLPVDQFVRAGTLLDGAVHRHCVAPA